MIRKKFTLKFETYFCPLTHSTDLIKTIGLLRAELIHVISFLIPVICSNKICEKLWNCRGMRTVKFSTSGSTSKSSKIYVDERKRGTYNLVRSQ